MEVQIISETVQKFNGESFYKCGNYFQHKGKRLHRAVWEYHNGSIPVGYHVHHIDENRSNNDISNLSLVLGSEHLRNHMLEDVRREKSRESVKLAIAEAPMWHHSKEGKEWHSKHSKEYWENAPIQTYKCSFCGKVYQTKNVRYKGNHFCHPNCKAAYRRMRVRNGEISK